MDLIKPQVYTAIKEHRTIRLVGLTPTHLLSSDAYVASLSRILEPLVSELEKDHKVQLIAVDANSQYTYSVLDIDNWDYDYETAHKVYTPIPVYVLRLSHGGDKWKFYRRPMNDQSTAYELADLH